MSTSFVITRIPEPGDAQIRSYVLVTPVRNEEATIGITLESVVNQTWKPAEWVIVDDGSSDATGSILERYAKAYPFIRVLTLRARPKRSFSSVVFATELGIRHLASREYAFIGLLDADIRLGPTYYAETIHRFEVDSTLGLAGGLVLDCAGSRRIRVSHTLHDVAGAVQFFRRDCFEALGGLIAIPEGGWDAITCVQARMHGFRTQTFADIEVDHLKPRNSAEGNVPRRHFALGLRDHALGNHIVFETFKCGQRALGSPFLIGGVARWCGYLWCCVSRRKRGLPPHLIAQIRREQMARLRSWIHPRPVQQPHIAASDSPSPPHMFDALP